MDIAGKGNRSSGLAIRKLAKRSMSERRVVAPTICRVWKHSNALRMSNSNFRSNTFAVDRENQFSASSMVYLKNSIPLRDVLGVNMNYRTSDIHDCSSANMEDKGMAPARTRTSQD
jgi:hypothetical protein